MFLFDFFPGVREWGDRASSRGLVLRLGLRHRRSDAIVITDIVHPIGAGVGPGVGPGVGAGVGPSVSSAMGAGVGFPVG